MPASLEWGPPLLPWIVEAVKTLGYEQMTPVQASVIPLLCGNKDIVAEAVTGSGKTLAFLLPLLVRLSRIEEPMRMGQTQAIIVEPTRELAYQTHRVLSELIALSPNPKLIRTQLVTGGNQSSRVADTKNFLEIRPHVLVATPGRLLDLLKAQHVNTRALDLLVFDEGDRLLDQDVDRVIPTILSLMPKQKRAALFSATMNENIAKDVVRMGMRNPVKVKVSRADNAAPEKLKLEYHNYGTDPMRKIPIAIGLLRTTQFRKAIVYIPTCTSVTHWYQLLRQFIPDDINVFSLHGKLLQGPRLKTLARFTENLDRSILLTTDVAARGLDIPDVDYVLQLDPPADPNMFVHRAGRTARAGRSGLCSVLLNGDLELGYVDFMKVRQIDLTEAGPRAGGLDPEEYLQAIQRFVKADRARHDLAIRSFLSFIRFYMKHTATSIFRLSSLDLCRIAQSFGVLRMPKMPELKDKEMPNEGWLTEPFDIESELKYADKKQEAARQERAVKAKESNAADAEARRARKRQNSVAWSKTLERKETAQKRRDKREKKAIGKKEAQQALRGDVDSSDDETQQDWKQVVQEQRKNKKQKVANPEFTFEL